jgi:hypothetical protein
VVPHHAGELHNADRELPLWTECRPDPASLSLHRMTSNAGLVLKNLPAALRAGWQQRSFPPGPAGNFANVGQQIVHLVAFKPRPRRAQLLHPDLHLRSMIPHGLRPHDGGVDALHSREVRCETAGRSLLAVAAHATFGREQALATALITGLVHISRRVQQTAQ